jgi:ribosomal protein S27AE
VSKFIDVTGTIVGERLNFNCPRCGEGHSWSLAQLAEIQDEAIADYCGKCGQGFRVPTSVSPGATKNAGSLSSVSASNAGMSETRNIPGAPPSAHSTSPAMTQSSPGVIALKRRYADAYIVAGTVNAFGLTIKVVGVIIGAIIVLLSFAAGSNGGVGILFALIGVAIAGTIATLLYILGTLASAQGQILKATLDSAVNTSRILSDHDCAEVMSLPDMPQKTNAAVAYQLGTANS